MNRFENIRELHDLNIELMDTLLVISWRFFEYCETHGIRIDGLDSLARLIDRAANLCGEMGEPYRGKPVIASDERYHDDSSDEEVPKLRMHNA